jgi:ribosome maturation factor RimP
MEGTNESPLFIHTMDTKSTIEKLLAELIQDPNYFLVDVIVSGSGAKTKISVLIDGDQGIDIDYCASISRKLGQLLEEQEIMQDAYILEVSSPGIDYPLQSVRQYQKNIGRELKISLNDGKEHKGVLVAVNEREVKILEKVKEKGKKITEAETVFLLNDIKKTKVLVSFK